LCTSAPAVHDRVVTLLAVRRYEGGAAAADVLVRPPGSRLAQPAFATVDAEGAWRPAQTQGWNLNGDEWVGNVLFPARGSTPLRLVAMSQRHVVWFDLPEEVFG
jgi:hypothetical protein